MKKVLSSFLLFIGLFSVTQVYAQTVTYPYSENLEKGQYLYHILPPNEVTDIYDKMVNTPSKRNKLLEIIKNNKSVTIRQTDAYKNLSNQPSMNEDIKFIKNLVHWLPGNIVIGPTPTPDKDKSSFNDLAFKCLKKVSNDGEFIKLLESWRTKKLSMEQKLIVLETLASRESIDASKMDCWKE